MPSISSNPAPAVGQLPPHPAYYPSPVSTYPSMPATTATAAAASPERRTPALASFHPLILAVCRETREFPAADPVELGLAIRGAALAAAEAVLASCEARAAGARLPAPAAVEQARSRLRELAYCIEIARRLGYLSTARVVELLALHELASDTVSRLADRVGRRPAL